MSRPVRQKYGSHQMLLSCTELRCLLLLAVVEIGAVNADTIQLVSTTPAPFIPGLSPKMNAIVNSPHFENFILFVVILNTCTLSAEHYGQSDVFTERLWRADLVFNIIYTTELLLKWFGIGIALYFQVLASIADTAKTMSAQYVCVRNFKLLVGTIQLPRLYNCLRQHATVHVLQLERCWCRSNPPGGKSHV